MEKQPPIEEKCDCKEMSCSKNCRNKHTHKGFFCNFCGPEAVKKIENKTVVNTVDDFEEELENPFHGQVRALYREFINRKHQLIVMAAESGLPITDKDIIGLGDKTHIYQELREKIEGMETNTDFAAWAANFENRNDLDYWVDGYCRAKKEVLDIINK
jgi:hypothetical protein